MKRPLQILLVLLSMGILCTEAFGLLIPFTKERIASSGKHCVHGYDGNFGQVGMYFSGDASAFNETIEEAGRPTYVTRTVILHPGPMVVPDYVAGKDELPADWLVTSWRGDHRGKSGWHVQVDIWLGGRIKLDELQIPKDFTVESGGEIDEFVKRHNAPNRRTMP